MSEDAWQKAIGGLTNNADGGENADLKAKQREIQQREWDDALNNVKEEGATTFQQLVKQRQSQLDTERYNKSLSKIQADKDDELVKIFNLVRSTPFYINDEPLHQTVKRIIDLNYTLSDKVDSIKNILS